MASRELRITLALHDSKKRRIYLQSPVFCAAALFEAAKLIAREFSDITGSGGARREWVRDLQTYVLNQEQQVAHEFALKQCGDHRRQQRRQEVNGGSGRFRMMRLIRGASRANFAGVCRALIATAAVALPVAAQAVPIDLNLFYREPSAPISIAADGSSATLSEDPSIFVVYLSNVPGLGDPQLLTPASGATFSFDYNFVEAPDNADIFHFALLDGNSGNPLAPYDMLFSSSASGTALFDLSSLAGTSIGLQFELLPDLAFDLGFGSMLTLSNLRLDAPEVPTEPPPVGVAEPGTWALMLAGLAIVLLRGRFALRTAR